MDENNQNTKVRWLVRRSDEGPRRPRDLSELSGAEALDLCRAAWAEVDLRSVTSADPEEPDGSAEDLELVDDEPKLRSAEPKNLSRKKKPVEDFDWGDFFDDD